MTGPDIGEQLSGWGTVAMLETRGRITGLPARAAVGFIEEPGGSLLVAAGDSEADWVRNLEAEPGCIVTIGERSFRATAETVDGAARNAAIVALILRYGTPSEGLGRGPVFRLTPQIGAPTPHAERGP